MPDFRIGRISEETRKAVDHIIRESIKDPRVSGTYCVTRAEVTRDLRYAKIHVSVLESERMDSLIKALQNAAGFIRRELGQRVHLRYTPELIFMADRNMEHGVRIAQILRELSDQRETDPHRHDEQQAR